MGCLNLPEKQRNFLCEFIKKRKTKVLQQLGHEHL